MTALLVAAGAALGAPLRFVLGHVLDRDFPHGTLVANVVGSTLLGFFSAMSLSGSALALLGTGFCGGLTTYSAFAVRVDEHRQSWGPRYAVLTLTLALLGCWLGYVAGAALA